MFGLKQDNIDLIKEVLQDFSVVEQALIFGSRAMGNYKRGSDIDIAIKGKRVKNDTVSRINYLLNEEIPLPYFFDVVHYESISNVDLLRHVDQVAQVFYCKENRGTECVVSIPPPNNKE